jgi:CTP synthase (UTP-ammonia lyase)
MRIAATERDGSVRAVERIDHPFFLGTLYQPQLRSSRGAPHPVFVGLLRAAISYRRGDAWASEAAN